MFSLLFRSQKVQRFDGNQDSAIANDLVSE